MKHSLCTVAVSQTGILGVAVFLGLSSGCFKDNKKVDYAKGGPTKQAEPSKPGAPESASKPPAIQQNQNEMGDGTDQGVKASAGVRPTPTVAPPPPPVIPPTAVPTPIPPVIPTVQPPPQTSAGTIEMMITAFSNMEHGFHVMEHGYRLVIEDSQGVVASAKMNVDACVNSELADAAPGQGYTRVLIRPEAQYIREGASSGQGSLKLCLDSNWDKPAASASCQDVSGSSLTGGDAERATQFESSGVSYQVNGKALKVNSNAPGLSAWHPVFGFACPQRSFKDYQSPIVKDFNFNSVPDLIDVSNEKKKVYFDLRAEGKAVRTGWVAPSDGFLVLDSNSDQKIVDGSEMFGEFSVVKGSSKANGGKNFANGFEALAQYDENKDGKVDAKDQIFSQLGVWFDRNSSGKAESGEIVSLRSLGVTEISLAWENAGTTQSPYIVADNEVRLKGTFRTKDKKVHSLYDVWFKQRRYSDTSLSSK